LIWRGENYPFKALISEVIDLRVPPNAFCPHKKAFMHSARNAFQQVQQNKHINNIFPPGVRASFYFIRSAESIGAVNQRIIIIAHEEAAMQSIAAA